MIQASAFVAIRRRPPVSQSASRLGSTLQEHRIVFVDFDQLREGLDSEVGERHHDILAEPSDPDQAILGVHFTGYVEQPVLALAEIRRDAVDSRDVRDFVDVHDQAARAKIAGSCVAQFHGNSSSSRCAGWAARDAFPCLGLACTRRGGQGRRLPRGSAPPTRWPSMPSWRVASAGWP